MKEDSQMKEDAHTLMNIQEILQYLPHRYPFLLVDKVLELNLSKSIVAVKNVTINEPFFLGHFPVKPVMPGVLIIEALAQAACILACRSIGWTPERGTLFYLATIENARFKKMVVPGDQIILKAEIHRRKANVWKFGGSAYVDGEVVCSADMVSSEGPAAW